MFPPRLVLRHLSSNWYLPIKQKWVIPGQVHRIQYSVSEISQITVGSTIPVAAFAHDADMDLESLQFFLGETPELVILLNCLAT